VIDIDNFHFSEEEMNLLRTHLGSRLVLEHWSSAELKEKLQKLKKSSRSKRFATENRK
jgi:hypothetical protein